MTKVFRSKVLDMTVLAIRRNRHPEHPMPQMVGNPTELTSRAVNDPARRKFP